MKRTLFVAGLSAMLAMPLLATSQQTPSTPGTSGASGSRMEQQEMRRQQEEMRSQPRQTGQQQEMRGQQGQTGQQHMSQDQVRQAQERLKEAGFDPGPIDGLLGEQTKQALREYQKAHGLRQTGQLDESTRESLMVQQTGESPGGSMPGGRTTDEPRPGSSTPGSYGSNR
jgi:peptidoglycan hydrolase-like protein with peptidoglycan-binding domain